MSTSVNILRIKNRHSFNFNLALWNTKIRRYTSAQKDSVYLCVVYAPTPSRIHKANLHQFTTRYRYISHAANMRLRLAGNLPCPSQKLHEDETWLRPPSHDGFQLLPTQATGDLRGGLCEPPSADMLIMFMRYEAKQTQFITHCQHHHVDTTISTSNHWVDHLVDYSTESRDELVPQWYAIDKCAKV